MDLFNIKGWRAIVTGGTRGLGHGGGHGRQSGIYRRLQRYGLHYLGSGSSYPGTGNHGAQLGADVSD